MHFELSGLVTLVPIVSLCLSSDCYPGTCRMQTGAHELHRSSLIAVVLALKPPASKRFSGIVAEPAFSGIHYRSDWRAQLANQSLYRQVIRAISWPFAFAECGLQKISIQGSTAVMIIMLEVFEHLYRRPNKVFREFRRVLSFGGKIIISAAN